MTVTVEWDDPTHPDILRYTFSGHWAWDELRAAFAEADAHMAAVTPPVHVIVDVLHSKTPTLDNWMREVIELVKRPNAHWSGIVVLVGSPVAFRVMVQQLQFLYPHVMPESMHFATSLADARDLLRRQGQG